MKYPPSRHVSAMTSLASFPENFKVDGQNPDEKILLFIREHKAVLVLRLLGYSIVLFLPLLLRLSIQIINQDLLNNSLNTSSFFTSKYWTCIVIFWLAYMLGGYFNLFFQWFYNINILTNNRFIDIDFLGIFSQRFEETSVETIQDAKDTQKGLIQSIFDMGDIEVLTASEKTVFNLSNVPKSNKIRDFIMDVVVARRNRMRLGNEQP